MPEYMKILFLARRFYPDIGGVETHVYEVGKILVKKGHSVTVVTQSRGAETEIDGIKIIRIPEFKKGKVEKFFIWKWFLENRKIIESAKIIHAHDVYFWYMPFRFIYPEKFSYITFHGFEKFPVSRKEILIRKISEKLADGNIAVGDFIEKWYKTKPDFVTYGGVNIPKVISRPIGKRSAVFIGRLDTDTNILDFSKAVKILEKRKIKIDLKIIGSGKYETELKKDFKVLKPDKDINKYMNGNKYVFSSSYLSILNAMAHKKMVFSIYNNNLKKDYLELSPMSSSIVIADSPERLADKINYFIDYPKETEKYIKEGFSFAKKNSWKNTTDLYSKLWRK